MLFRAADSRLPRTPVPSSPLKSQQKIAQECEEIQVTRRKCQAEFDAWQRAWQQVVADMSVDLDRLPAPATQVGDPLVLRAPRIVM
ncbi:MAG: hypothetical protein ACK5TO_04755 [Planctomycetaceae bacterium]|jgi:hypothetical protein